jgi:protein-S-isoprenylcysteine O-methyltransferase Ste14
MMKEKLKWGQRGEWYVVVQFVLFALIFFVPLLAPSSELVEWQAPWDLVGVGLGLVLASIGGLTALAGVMSLGANLAAVPFPREDATLVEKGAFRFVRHPIYSGIILGSFGWGLLTNSLLALLLSMVLFIFFDLKSRREERWLSEKYADYPAYQARVRKLIPLIY